LFFGSWFLVLVFCVLDPYLSGAPIEPSPGEPYFFFLINKVGKKIKAVEKWLKITAHA
jgi:hypothetical protein